MTAATKSQSAAEKEAADKAAADKAAAASPNTTPTKTKVSDKGGVWVKPKSAYPLIDPTTALPADPLDPMHKATGEQTRYEPGVAVQADLNNWLKGQLREGAFVFTDEDGQEVDTDEADALKAMHGITTEPSAPVPVKVVNA